MGHYRHMFADIRASFLDLGFSIICEYGNPYHDGPHEFLVEAKTEEADALFVLTWSQYINSNQYTHDKARKLPADWITFVLHYSLRIGQDHLGYVFPSLILITVVPVLLSHFYNMLGLMFISFTGYVGMLFLVVLRVYDDYRQSRHERKQRMLDF